MAFRYGPETRAILTELRRHRQELGYEENLKSGLWEFHKFNLTDYKIFITTEHRTDRGILMTGSDVTTSLTIPFAHTWLMGVLKHLSSAYAASTDAVYVLLNQPQGSIEPLAYGEEYIYRGYDLTDSRITLSLPNNFRFPAGTYNLVLNSTSTDIIVPLLKVRRDAS